MFSEILLEATRSHKFEDDCREAVLDLRGALLSLYREAGADPLKPQDVSRRFHLNKNLTWKIARIVQAEDALAAVPLIPGAGGLDILLDAMSAAGAADKSVARAREAVGAFERMIEIHVGDRASLELMLDSMGGSDRQLEKSRKLAYRGNTGIWGVHARARVTAQFLAPNPENPHKLDIAQMATLESVRRLRNIPPWPVFRIWSQNSDLELNESEPLDPKETDRPGLIRWSCRGRMPEIQVSEKSDGIVYEIGDGPVGRTGDFSCAFGYVHRANADRYATDEDATGSLYAAISMPMEVAQFDVFVHRDLPEALSVQPSVFGQFWGELGVLSEAARLPIHDRVADLGRGATVATPLSDIYGDLVQSTFDHMGWAADDFHCLRLIVKYPPMPSMLALQFKLALQPPSGR